MDAIKPQKLTKGDTVGFLSVSGDVKDFSLIEKAVKIFESEGFSVKVSDNCYKKKAYLSGSDEERAKAFNDFFKDPKIKAVVAIRGGYGAIRILDKIDWEAVKENPKIFVGYSDITALSLMLYKKTGLVTFSGAMAYSDFGCGITDYTKKSFFDALCEEVNEILIDSPKVFCEGQSQGILWGGNLSTIQSLCGLDFIPDEKFIFLVEDVNEPVYKIDKMFTQLLNINKFKQNLSGVVLGDFSGVDDGNLLGEFFDELSADLAVPFVGGLKFGHEKDKHTVPIGVEAVLDTGFGVIRLNPT